MRSICDIMHAFFVIDEYTDSCSPTEGQRITNIVMDAIRNPHEKRPEGEWLGGELMRQ